MRSPKFRFPQLDKRLLLNRYFRLATVEQLINPHKLAVVTQDREREVCKEIRGNEMIKGFFSSEIVADSWQIGITG